MRVTTADFKVAGLIQFEERVADMFSKGEIRHPVHLSGGNERQLVEVFERYVGPDDWICCTWRAHLHALLKGVPIEDVFDAIRRGHSIALCFPEHRMISSAIVGGMAPVAVGLAMGIKRKQEERKVVCFIGDMAWESGGVQEAVKYASNHRLPILWVVEDNGLSCCTPTDVVWGVSEQVVCPNAIRYYYENSYPHCGIGRFVQF